MNIDLHAKWESERVEGDISFKLGDPKPHCGPVQPKGSNSSPKGSNSSPEGSNTSTLNWTWDDLKSFLTAYKMIKESGIVTDVDSLMDRLSDADFYVPTWPVVAIIILKLLLWLSTVL